MIILLYFIGVSHTNDHFGDMWWSLFQQYRKALIWGPWSPRWSTWTVIWCGVRLMWMPGMGNTTFYLAQTWKKLHSMIIPKKSIWFYLIDAVGRRWPTRVYSAIMPCSGNGPHTRNDTAPGGSWLFVRGDCVQHVQNQQRSTHYRSIISIIIYPFC